MSYTSLLALDVSPNAVFEQLEADLADTSRWAIPDDGHVAAIVNGSSDDSPPVSPSEAWQSNPWLVLQAVLLRPGRMAWLTANASGLGRVPKVRKLVAGHLLSQSPKLLTFASPCYEDATESEVATFTAVASYLAETLRMWCLLTDLAWTSGLGFDKAQVQQVLDWATEPFLTLAKNVLPALSLVAGVCLSNSLALNDIHWNKYCAQLGNAYIAYQPAFPDNPFYADASRQDYVTFTRLLLLYHVKDHHAIAALIASPDMLNLPGFNAIEYLPRLRNGFLMNAKFANTFVSGLLWTLPIAQPVPSEHAYDAIDALYCLHACLSSKAVTLDVQGGAEWLVNQLDAVDDTLVAEGSQLPALFIPTIRIWAKNCPRLGKPNKSWLEKKLSLLSDASEDVALLPTALVCLFLLNLPPLERARLDLAIPYGRLIRRLQQAAKEASLYFEVLAALHVDIARAMPEILLPLPSAPPSPEVPTDVPMTVDVKDENGQLDWPTFFNALTCQEDIRRLLAVEYADDAVTTILWLTTHLFQTVQWPFRSSYADLCYDPLLLFIPIRNIAAHAQREKLMWVFYTILRYFLFAFEARVQTKCDAMSPPPMDANAFINTQKAAVRLLLAESGHTIQNGVILQSS